MDSSKATERHYRTLYFSLDNAADVAILRRLFAIPRRRRNRAIKEALLTCLAPELGAAVLSEAELREVLAQQAASAPRRRRATPPSIAGPAPVSRSTAITQVEHAAPLLEKGAEEAPVATMEDKLDRLMRGPWVR